MSLSLVTQALEKVLCVTISVVSDTNVTDFCMSSLKGPFTVSESRVEREKDQRKKDKHQIKLSFSLPINFAWCEWILIITCQQSFLMI